MKWLNIFIFCSLSLSSYAEIPSELTDEKAAEIGNLVWYNECKKSVDGLLSWNENENFASLGIGHFIWYPENKRDVYEEMFPALVEFFQQQNVSLPAWLNPQTPCPWNSKAEFLSASKEPKYKELKELLSQTIALQAKFMAKRIHSFLEKKIKEVPFEEQKHIEECVKKIIKEPSGYYALIDYLNFKGEGLQQNEHYAGFRWGLFQVLKSMDLQNNQSPIQEFVKNAKFILKQRVEHAPQDKDENRWLPGWYKRLDSYTLQIKENS